MAEWIRFKDQRPNVGDFIAAYREPFPSFYTIGEYGGFTDDDDEDLFTHWFLLPIPPEVRKPMEEIYRALFEEDIHRPLVDICQGDLSRIVTSENPS